MVGLGSISKSLSSTLGERRASVSLLELDDTDSPGTNDYITFQYFPESISDTKQANYQTKDIPGGSLPLYQWTSGGERGISFTAVFTSDLDLTQDPNTFPKLVQNGLVRRNIDPRSAVLWLRRFMHPRYGDSSQVGVPLTKAPRKALLYMPNSGIGLAGLGDPATLGDANRVLVLMTQCDVTWASYFPSGQPRIVEVSLSFVQTAQIAGAIAFPADSDKFANIVAKGSDTFKVFPYPLKVKIS